MTPWPSLGGGAACILTGLPYSFLSRKVRPTESDKNPNLKFVNNRFIAQLGQIEQLVKFAEKSKLNWVDHSDFLRRLLDNIEASDIYKEYMESGVDTLLRTVPYRQQIIKQTVLTEALVLYSQEKLPPGSATNGTCLTQAGKKRPA